MLPSIGKSFHRSPWELFPWTKRGDCRPRPCRPPCSTISWYAHERSLVSVKNSQVPRLRSVEVVNVSVQMLWPWTMKERYGVRTRLASMQLKASVIALFYNFFLVQKAISVQCMQVTSTNYSLIVYCLTSLTISIEHAGIIAKTQLFWLTTKQSEVRNKK